MPYRLEVDYRFNVRAKKGERRERGTGALIKALIYRGSDIRECMAEAVVTRNAMGSDGYATVIDVRGYDEASFKADSLKAVPNFKSAELI